MVAADGTARPERLRVLMVNPNGDLFGASRMFVESVRSMTERHAWVQAVIPRAGPLAAVVEALGAEVIDVPGPTLRKTLLTPRGLVGLIADTVRGVPAGIRAIRRARPDVLYVNTVIQPLWILLGRLLRIPVVCHVHEAEASSPRAQRWVLALPLLAARIVIVNSEFAEHVLVTETMPRLRTRTRVVHNGVEAPPHPAAARPEIQTPIRLLFVGRLSERKGPADAIAAVAVLRELGCPAHLDIVGSVFPGREPFEAELRRQVLDAHLTADVTFHGFVPDVWPWLARADVVVVPSRSDESFGNAAVEGVLAGRPVIVTENPGLREATAGLASVTTVPVGDPAAIARAARRVRDRWSEYGLQAAADREVLSRRLAPTRYRELISAGLVDAATDEPGRSKPAT